MKAIKESQYRPSATHILQIFHFSRLKSSATSPMNPFLALLPLPSRWNQALSLCELDSPLPPWHTQLYPSYTSIGGLTMVGCIFCLLVYPHLGLPGKNTGHQITFEYQPLLNETKIKYLLFTWNSSFTGCPVFLFAKPGTLPPPPPPTVVFLMAELVSVWPLNSHN